MTDLRSFLKESGYLDSPSQRLLWKVITPSFRNHLRLLGLLILLGALPCSLLLSSLSRLHDSDKVVLFLFYFFTAALFLILIDVFQALLLKVPVIANFAARGWVNGLPVALTGCYFLGGLYLLDDIAILKTPGAQALLWLAVALSAFMLALPPRLMIISRLYWHGFRPPTYRRTGWITLLALFATVGLKLGSNLLQPSVPLVPAAPQGKVVVLGFDIPPNDQEAYAAIWPSWNELQVSGETGTITDFWAGLGTGTSKQFHKASLFHMRSPLFMGILTSKDPTQRLPLRILKVLGLVRAEVGGGRYRKYAWEILDDYGIKTAALGYWHSFPAASQNGIVVSERWQPDRNEAPYVSGLATTYPSSGLRFSGNRALRRLVAMENQLWSQLRQEIAEGVYPFSVAYFPLGDNLERLPDTVRIQYHQQLMAYRQKMLTDFLGNLGDDVAVGIVIASGKTWDRQAPMSARLIYNAKWQQQISPNISHSLQFTPTILNFFGLPADYLMYTTAYSKPVIFPEKHIDYGEPQRNFAPNQHQDNRYYQELKALGYIQ